jgi:ATP-dependent helicase/nuclease subunit A
MNILQIQASDPDLSTWVSASAGTGKTKILTDRVLRLLLRNADFSKILCLTFTNAAAGEMKERIANALLEWANADDELEQKLYLTTGKECTKEEVILAKSLYAKYLNSDEKINVQTIHSFCQKLLKRFPLEANITPNFTVIDEIKSNQILRQIKKDLLNEDRFCHINEYLNVNFHEITIDEIISEFVQDKTKFLNVKYQFESVEDESYRIVQLLENLASNEWEDISIIPIVEDIIGLNQSPAQIKQFFLTELGQKRKKIVTNKIAKEGSSLYIDLQKIQDRVFELDQIERKNQLRLHSQILFILGRELLKGYETYKIKQGVLDYDDLIIYAGRLLKDSNAKEWVLYKLDGGIDHLLVDEAQDTSFNQWQIIEALIEEFYSGDSRDAKKQRTIFVVGDEKQSIFSFQGADVKSFARMNSILKSKMQHAGKKFKNIELETSYRSTKEILNGVELVFDNIHKQMPEIFNSDIKRLDAYRSKYTGTIEIWSLCAAQQDIEEFWSVLSESIVKNPQQILAEKISTFIKEKISTKRVLPSTGKEINANDFMILFRRRDELTNEVIRALKQNNIEVTGLDRILLNNNLAVNDLLSIAKFVLNPYDDLNLCSLLKSPIIGFSEKEIYELSTNRKDSYIWNSLKQNENYSEVIKQLQSFIKLYQVSHIGNFFERITDIMGYRNILNLYCEPDSNDAIDELIYASVNFYKQNNSSIQSFVLWLQNNTTSIKRNSDNANKVRIMTVHASKGLQSPFVILCDTTSSPVQDNIFQWSDEDDMPLSAKNSNWIPECFKKRKEEEKKNTYAEYLRLLYVAMTRAEDHLIICGYQRTNTLPKNCWYELVKSSLSQQKGVKTEDKFIIGCEAENIPKTHKVEELPTTEVFHNNFNNRNIKIEDWVKFNYSNTSPLMQKDPANYGLIFHKILEDSLIVPDLTIMKTHPLIRTLEQKSKERILRSIDRIIDNAQFCELIKENFRTEISIGMKNQHGSNKIGRIDLMIIKNSEVIIIDYKSDYNPPKYAEQIPKNYTEQLMFYKQTIQEIYPGKNVSTMILWLEKGQLMSIRHLKHMVV